MSRYQKDLGDFGEDAAVAYLKKKGYRIIKRNFRATGGEIDVIAQTKNTLVFVEVKTRKNANYGFPAEAVDYRKQQHLFSAAREYLRQKPTRKEIRFDVIEVYASSTDGIFQLSEIQHIENVILEGRY